MYFSPLIIDPLSYVLLTLTYNKRPIFSHQKCEYLFFQSMLHLLGLNCFIIKSTGNQGKNVLVKYVYVSQNLRFMNKTTQVQNMNVSFKMWCCLFHIAWEHIFLKALCNNIDVINSDPMHTNLVDYFVPLEKK